jgi:hypothetical protein
MAESVGQARRLEILLSDDRDNMAGSRWSGSDATRWSPFNRLCAAANRGCPMTAADPIQPVANGRFLAP